MKRVYYSLSFCVQDIVEGRTVIDDIGLVLACTNYQTEDDWANGIERMSKIYWPHERGWGNAFCVYLKEHGLIFQRRVDGIAVSECYDSKMDNTYTEYDESPLYRARPIRGGKSWALCRDSRAKGLYYFRLPKRGAYGMPDYIKPGWYFVHSGTGLTLESAWPLSHFGAVLWAERQLGEFDWTKHKEWTKEVKSLAFNETQNILAKAQKIQSWGDYWKWSFGGRPFATEKGLAEARKV